MFQWLNLTLWLAAFGVGFACAYGVDSNGAKVAGADGSAAGAVAYDSFVRIGWPLALSWVVYACEKGYGGYSTKPLIISPSQPRPLIRSPSPH